MILLIDNYDSFSYNLYQLIGSLIEKGDKIKVIRNDELSFEEVEDLNPSHIVISPGPGRPQDAGICEELIKKLSKKIPVLGVCLGHQAICEAYGGVITYAKELMHGKHKMTKIDRDCILFKGLPEEIAVARYHSLAASEKELPSELVVRAKSDDGEIMAVEHVSKPIFGLQFHPESIMTPEGKTIMKNFLEIR